MEKENVISDLRRGMGDQTQASVLDTDAFSDPDLGGALHALEGQVQAGVPTQLGSMLRMSEKHDEGPATKVGGWR